MRIVERMKQSLITSWKEIGTRVGEKVELRCPRACGCSPKGKLLATLVDFPVGVFGSGAVLHLVCPSRKSRVIEVVL